MFPLTSAAYAAMFVFAIFIGPFSTTAIAWALSAQLVIRTKPIGIAMSALDSKAPTGCLKSAGSSSGQASAKLSVTAHSSVAAFAHSNMVTWSVSFSEFSTIG